MQISDEMLRVAVEADSKAFYAGAGKEACMRRALESALSLPVQPVADAEPAGFFVLAEPGFKPFFCRSREDAEHTADNYRKYVNGCTSTSIEPLYRTPPVPPTKGPEDDLIAALNAAKSALIDAQEELRLIRMKDTGAVYDTVLRSLTLPSAIRQADEALALRSRPASALPVVGEDGLSFDAMFQAVEAVTSMGQTSADPLDDMVNRTTAAMKAYRAALIPSVQP